MTGDKWGCAHEFRKDILISSTWRLLSSACCCKVSGRCSEIWISTCSFTCLETSWRIQSGALLLSKIVIQSFSSTASVVSSLLHRYGDLLCNFIRQFIFYFFESTIHVMLCDLSTQCRYLVLVALLVNSRKLTGFLIICGALTDRDGSLAKLSVLSSNCVNPPCLQTN